MNATFSFGGNSLTARKYSNRPIVCKHILLMAIIGFAAIFIFPAESYAEDPIFNTIVNPDEYTIGPGDQFQIDFWDGSTLPIEVTVTPEGFLLLTSMGQIDVGNLSLTAARNKLRELVSKFYSENQFSVTLIGARPVKILLGGGVKKPGLYEGRVSQRVSELIDKAGGLISGASRRNIELSGGVRPYKVDLLRFERAGDLTANPCLYSGYKINVPMVADSSNFVQISGEVVTPNGFEFKDGDNLGAILELAMGLTGLQGDRALIFRKDTLHTIKLDSLYFPIKAGDKIIVLRKDESVEPDYFSCVGEVKVPGRYPYEKGMGLARAIQIAGALAERGDIYSLIIYRKMENRSQLDISDSAMLNLNNLSIKMPDLPVAAMIENYNPDRLNEIKIYPGDSIYIPALTGSVGVFGLVNHPGAVVFSPPAMSLSQAINQAGGYARGADKGKIEIRRKGSGLRIVGGRGVSIFDGDMLFVPAKKETRSFLSHLRDISLILGGVGITYLAIDNLSD
jgi:protein involved in polysaccharide export with SLBB domain